MDQQLPAVDIHMVTTALNPPTLTFADEQIPQFEITAYNSTVTYNNYTATQLKAGYWDQNVRNPGSQLPRDGGICSRRSQAKSRQQAR